MENLELKWLNDQKMRSMVILCYNHLTYVLIIAIHRKCGADKQSGDKTGIFELGDKLTTVEQTEILSEEICTTYAFSIKNGGEMTSQQQRKDIIDYGNSGSKPMQIKICHCTPHWAQEDNLAVRERRKKTSQNKLSQSGCNGPRSGIETHPQGLKCWTCGETADAIDCTEFPYDSKDHQDKEDVSGNHDSDTKLDGQPTSASGTVKEGYQKEWSKQCLKNDKYCVVQFIVDRYGKKRKYLVFNLHYTLSINIQLHIPWQ